MDQPYDRVNLGLRERPVSGDFNRLQSQIDRAIRDSLGLIVSPRTSLTSPAVSPKSGFFGHGFRVVPSSPVAMTVQVSTGLGFMYQPLDLPADIGATDLESVDDLSPWKPVWLAAPAVFAVPTAPGVGQARIDIIEVRHDRRLDDFVVRRQLDTATESMLDHSFYKTLTFQLDGRTGTVNSPSNSTAAISYKVGAVAAAGAEVEPSVTAGYVQIARINVGASVVSIGESALVDRRVRLAAGGAERFSGVWRVQWNGGSPIITAIAIDAPPGVQLALTALALRGAATFYALGGEIANGAVILNAGHQSGHSFTDRFSLGLQAPQGTGNQVTSVDTTIQTALAAGTPAVNVGVGTKALRGRIISRFLTNTGASNETDASLEDALIIANGSLSY